jgi:hypothetical protein
MQEVYACWSGPKTVGVRSQIMSGSSLAASHMRHVTHVIPRRAYVRNGDLMTMGVINERWTG